MLHRGNKDIFLESMAVMSVKDDEKITEISSYEDDKKNTEISSFRTIRMALFCPATEKCPKERANGGTDGSPLDPPSFRRPLCGRTWLKG